MKHFHKTLFSWMMGTVLSFILLLSPIGLQAGEVMTERAAGLDISWEVLKREAYYHFFLEDYLTAATRLKSIESSGETVNDTRIVQEVKILLGSLYLAWGMDRSAIRMFMELDDVITPGDEQSQLLLKVVKAQYERALYGPALETHRLIPSKEDAGYTEQAQYFAGLSHYASGAIEDGIQSLKMISPLSPYFPYAQLTLAKSYVQLNDFTQSRRLLRTLSEADTGGNRLLRRLAEKSRLTWGQLLIEERDFGEARRVLALIPQESPFFPDSLFGMGWTQFKEENYLEAILTFQDLIAAAPDHAYALEALTVLGNGYKKLGAFQKALDHYAEAIEIYGQQVGEIREFQAMLEDPDALSGLLKEFEGQEGPLAGFFQDDRIRFWSRQYRDLLKMESYLDQKLRDMGVFEVMVDHRERVFRQYLPVVRRFLKETPLQSLRKKGDVLRTNVEQAVQEEGIPALASIEEAEAFKLLSRAVRQSITLRERINTLNIGMDQLVAQKQEWQRVDRWLKIALGELVWKITTEVPGRSDDLRRGVRAAMADLELMEKKHAGLIVSVPALEKEIEDFRHRIKVSRATLRKLRKKTIVLREALLPPLQEIFLRASEKRLNRIVSLVAAAELSRIQILDEWNGKSAQ